MWSNFLFVSLVKYGLIFFFGIIHLYSVHAQSTPPTEVKTLNQLLEQHHIDKLPNDLNLIIESKSNGSTTVKSPEGKVIASNQFGYSVFYNNEHLRNYNQPNFYGTCIIEINPYEYRALTSPLVQVYEGIRNQHFKWERGAGLPTVRYRKSEFSPIGITNSRQKRFLLEPEYTNISRLFQDKSDHPFVYRLEKEGKVGLAFENGKLILPAEYDDISYQLIFQEYRLFKNQKGVGLVTSSGAKKLWGNYSSVDVLKTDGSIYVQNFVVKKDKKWGLLDSALRVRIPVEYDSICYDRRLIYDSPEVFEDGEQLLYRVYKGSNYGLYNGYFELIIPPNYQEVMLLGQGLYLAKDSTHTTIYTLKGEVILSEPIEKMDAFPTLKNNHKQAFYLFKMHGDSSQLQWFNQKGEWVKSLPYSDFKARNNGSLYSFYQYILVQQDSLWGAIDREGNEILPPVYDSLHYFNPGYFLGQQFIQLISKSKKGLITITGEVILPPVYDHISMYYAQSMQLIEVVKEGKKGLVTVKGEVVVPTEFEFIDKKKHGRCIVVQKNDLFGAYSTEGVALVPPQYNFWQPRYLRSLSTLQLEFFNDKTQQEVLIVECVESLNRTNKQ